MLGKPEHGWSLFKLDDMSEEWVNRTLGSLMARNMFPKSFCDGLEEFITVFSEFDPGKADAVETQCKKWFRSPEDLSDYMTGDDERSADVAGRHQDQIS